MKVFRKFADLLISERTVVTAILLNTAALFILSSLAGQDRRDSPWFIIDYACVVFFTIEASVKIGRFGWSAYWKNGWNRFDFLIVILSLPMLLAPFVNSLESFGIFMLLRVGRLFRMFRLMRFIPNGRHLVIGIKRALKASVGVILALALINLVLAVGATMLFGELAPQYFGSPFMAVYSTFKVFTVEGWYEIPDFIAYEAVKQGRLHPGAWAAAARIYFVIAVMIGGILGLSIVNAVFVDEMTMDNTHDLENKVDALADEIAALRKDLSSRNSNSS